MQVFVANPNKPREVKMILAKNHEKLLELLHNLSAGKGNYFLGFAPSTATLAPDMEVGCEISFEIVFKESSSVKFYKFPAAIP